MSGISPNIPNQSNIPSDALSKTADMVKGRVGQFLPVKDLGVVTLISKTLQKEGDSPATWSKMADRLHIKPESNKTVKTEVLTHLAALNIIKQIIPDLKNISEPFELDTKIRESLVKMQVTSDELENVLKLSQGRMGKEEMAALKLLSTGATKEAQQEFLATEEGAKAMMEQIIMEADISMLKSDEQRVLLRDTMSNGITGYINFTKLRAQFNGTEVDEKERKGRIDWFNQLIDKSEKDHVQKAADNPDAVALIKGYANDLREMLKKAQAAI